MLQRIIANVDGLVRNDTMEGKPFMVVPVVMVVEGVLHANEGPLLYPAEELSKVPVIWNAKPVIVYHPDVDEPTACTPAILTNRKVGVLMNTKFEDGKLKAEAWIEPDRAAAVDNRVVEAIDKKEVMELSTGLFLDVDKTSGTFNGIDYIGIARNYRPDHLALLPDQVGASSIADGAGFLRLNAAGDSLTLSLKDLSDDKKKWMQANKKQIFKTISNELSFDDTRQILYSLLQTSKGDDADFWIEETYEDFFIYEQDGSFFKQEYEEIDNVVGLKGLPTAVSKQVSYEPVTNKSVKNRKDNEMKLEKIVTALIENEATHWTEEDKDTLMAMNKEVLEKMIPIVKEPESVVNKDDNSVGATDVVVNKVQPIPTAEEYILSAPPEIQAVLKNSLATHNVEKTKMINIITKNENNTFTEEFLRTKDLEELTNIANLSQSKEEIAINKRFNYAGQGDPANVSNHDQEPMSDPEQTY